MNSHVVKLVSERGGQIRFIRAMEQGQPCWFYLRISPQKLAEYERGLTLGALNIRDFGEILQSGWGAHPPQHLIEFMQETHGIETPEDAAQ